MSGDTPLNDPRLQAEHFCGEFPGPGPWRERHKVHILPYSDEPGYYWSNLKCSPYVEGTAYNGPYPTAWHAFEGALKVYPRMAECDAYATWVLIGPHAKHPPRVTRPRRRAIR